MCSMNPLRKKSDGFIETLLEVYLFLKISWLEFVNACQCPGQGGFSEELICIISSLFQVYPTLESRIILVLEFLQLRTYGKLLALGFMPTMQCFDDKLTV